MYKYLIIKHIVGRKDNIRTMFRIVSWTMQDNAPMLSYPLINCLCFSAIYMTIICFCCPALSSTLFDYQPVNYFLGLF